MRNVIKKILVCLMSLIMAFSFIPCFESYNVYADSYGISNPRVTSSETVWDCVYFGSYPQTEVVAERSQCGTHGKEWENNFDCIVDPSLYSQLENTVSWGDDNVGWVEDSKYKRIKKADATCANKPFAAYKWSDSTTYHYFKYEPIKWRVLDVDGDNAFLLADKGLDGQKYNETRTSVTWETCTLRNWLNNTFINTFSNAEKAEIYTTTVENEDNIGSGTEGGSSTSDKIFLLSESEVYNTDKAVNYGFVKNRKTYAVQRRSKATTYAKAMGLCYRTLGSYSLDPMASFQNCLWWLRSPGYQSEYAANVAPSGLVNQNSMDNFSGEYVDAETYGHAIRPALHLDLSSSVWSLAGTISSAETDIGLETTFHGKDKNVSTNLLGINYSDFIFYQNCSSYHNDIAKCALVLANNCESSKSAIEQTMDDWEFEIIDSQNYNNEAVCDNPAYTIGYKTINKNGSEKHLIAMAIRGTSNFGDVLTDLCSAFRGPFGADGFLTAGNNMAGKLRNAVDKIETDNSVTLTQNNTLLFITGHSLGGACAGQVARLCGDLTNDSNRYVYTFASPQYDTQGDYNFTGVYNICSVDDAVPSWELGKYQSVIGKWIHKFYRIGTDKWCKPKYGNATFNANMSKFYNSYDPNASYFLTPKTWQNHLPSTYMASLLTEEPGGYEMTLKNGIIKIISALCPVDIEVYDSTGELVGKTVDGVPQNYVDSDVHIVSQDGHKFAILPDDQEYTVKVIGDDTGTMKFVEQSVDTEDNEIVSEKTFDNVAIYDGKVMTTDVDTEESVQDAKLYVLNDSGSKAKEIGTNGTETDVTTDQGSGTGGGSTTGGGPGGGGGDITPPEEQQEEPKEEEKPKEDKVVVPTTSIKSIKAGKNFITLKWSKKAVLGYQVQYSTSSKFTKGKTKTKTISKAKTTSIKIKGLKRKRKYYVRISSFVKEDGIKLNSKWSKAKQIKTK